MEGIKRHCKEFLEFSHAALALGDTISSPQTRAAFSKWAQEAFNVAFAHHCPEQCRCRVSDNDAERTVPASEVPQ